MNAVINALDRFRGLQNYTTLKLQPAYATTPQRFRGLQNYTTLKLRIRTNN